MTQEIDQLIEYLTQFDAFTPDELRLIAGKFSLAELKTNDYFITKDEPVKQIGFVVEGVLSACSLNKNGRVENSYFMPAGHFVSEAKGLYNQQPAALNLQAVVPTRLLVMDIADLHGLMAMVPNLNDVFRQVSGAEDSHIVTMQSFPRNLSATEKIPEEFRILYPELARLVPDNVVASFLGITKYHFSAVKKKVAR